MHQLLEHFIYLGCSVSADVRLVPNPTLLDTLMVPYLLFMTNIKLKLVCNNILLVLSMQSSNPCLHRMIGLFWLATTPNKELRLEYKSALLPLSCLENCRFSNISVTKKTIYYNDSYALPIGGNLSSPCTIMCPVSF